MGVNTKHPKYAEFEKDWELIRDNLGGEPKIKSRNTEYLPKTKGMIDAERDNPDNCRVYEAYKKRAQFPEWLKDALRSMTGLVSTLRDKQELELVHGVLKPLEEQATDDGFDLFELFLRFVNLGTAFGRYGGLADFDDKGNPYIAIYDAFSIINWKVGNVGGRRDLNLVVLEEQHVKADADEFSHETETVYRVLDLDEQGFYRVRLIKDDTVIDEVYPTMGSKKVSFIPFVFGGSINNSHELNPIPLLTMARSAVKYYQLSADYFQSLHMASHPQPYIIGAEAKREVQPDGSVISVPPIKYTGASAIWFLDSQVKQVSYLEYQGKGISDNREEMERQKSASSEAGAKVIDAGGVESGEARKARQEDQHATLHTIVQSASNAVEQIIKYLAEWHGLKTDKIVFNVPLEFSAEVNQQVLAALITMAQAQRISWATVMQYMQTGKLPDGEYELEVQRIIEEQNQMPSIANVNNSVDSLD